MKAWAIGVLAAALFGAVVGTPVCFAADIDVEEDGGTRDTSIRHAEPVVISSTEISSFWLRLEKNENGATCHLEYWTEGKPSRKADFPVNGDAFARLDALLKEHDVAQIDGHSMQNSALGDFMNLEVNYESGEQIYASGEGGGVKPDARYYREEWFIDFFRALGREYKQNVLEGIA